MQYNWQQPGWPNFQFNPLLHEAAGLTFVQKAAYAQGILGGTDTAARAQFTLDLLVQEAIRSTAIEGEFLSRPDLVSSIRKHLGWSVSSPPIRDQRAAGMAELLVQARISYAENLNETMLFNWHLWLMRGYKRINAGQWRRHSDPMQIVSGAIGHEIIHFEAPPSKDVPKEMAHFFHWFNESGPNGKTPIANGLVRAALAHLYFESIHPFEDGNGRIGRVIAEKALSQYIGNPVLLSLSSVIETDRKAYYNALQKAQYSHSMATTDAWIVYFTKITLEAQEQFSTQVLYAIRKARFFDRYRHQLNERQYKVVSKMLSLEEGNFQGGMNARKYQSITRASKATATRDLQDMLAKGVLSVGGGGRSTHYQLKLED